MDTQVFTEGIALAGGEVCTKRHFGNAYWGSTSQSAMLKHVCMCARDGTHSHSVREAKKQLLGEYLTEVGSTRDELMVPMFANQVLLS